MLPTGVQIQYHLLCSRKLWLFSHNIRMEPHSDTVSEGRLIHETVHPRRAKQFTEVSIGPVKIDYYDKKSRTIHEIKKSSKMEEAHIWQLKYYLYIFEQNGIEGVTGILEYPTRKESHTVTLESDDRKKIERIIIAIESIVHQEQAPPRIEKRFCRSCSYHDFCWSGEEEEKKEATGTKQRKQHRVSREGNK